MPALSLLGAGFVSGSDVETFLFVLDLALVDPGSGIRETTDFLTEAEDILCVRILLSPERQKTDDWLTE